MDIPLYQTIQKLSGSKQLLLTCSQFSSSPASIWVVLLLVLSGITQVALVMYSLTWARWSKMVFVTCLLVVAGCQLSHVSPSEEPALIYMVGTAFQENPRAEAARSRLGRHITSLLSHSNGSEQVIRPPLINGQGNRKYL